MNKEQLTARLKEIESALEKSAKSLRQLSSQMQLLHGQKMEIHHWLLSIDNAEQVSK